MSAATPSTLTFTTDCEPGIRRLRRGSGFAYLDAEGRNVRDEAVLQRIRRLAIPPAYRDVWICLRDDGHLQATGRDARGRKQYRYHAQWQLESGQTKFGHLREFGRALPRIRRRVQRELAGDGQPTRSHVLAALVRLLDTTWLRIGNDEYARANGSYGLSTLRARHAGVRGAALRLAFTGKSGVQHDVLLNDRRVAAIVRRCRELPGQELFRYLDADGSARRIGSADVNGWLAEAADTRVTAKDFRTWHGSVQALALVLGAAATDAPPAPLVLWAEVARRLGNTVAVCRKAYIHPQVLALGESLVDPASRRELLGRSWVQAPPAVRGLNVAERQLLGLLARRRGG